MDFSRRDTNEKNESSSVDDRKKGNHKKRKRSAKQFERCRKYRERLQNNTDTGINPGAGKQNNTDTGINPGAGKQINTDTGIHSGAGKQNNTDTGIHSGAGKQNNTDTGINPGAGKQNNTDTGKQNNTETGINPGVGKQNNTDTEINPGAGKQNNTDTGINPGAGKQNNTNTVINPGAWKQNNTETGINPDVGKQNNTDTEINPGAGKQNNTDTGINPDKEGRDQQLRQHPVVPPFQIPALYIPGATAMHQPIYFFSPGMIPPAHVVGNTYISSSNTCNTTMLPSRQSDTDESRGQTSEQGIARIPIEDSAGNAGSISSNERHNQDVISDITTAENESIDINSNDTDHNNPIPDDTTSPDNNNDDNKNSDYDIFGIMTVFVNSHLHGVLSTDASMGNSSKDDKDFGYSYFCLANLLK